MNPVILEKAECLYVHSIITGADVHVYQKDWAIGKRSFTSTSVAIAAIVNSELFLMQETVHLMH